MDCLDSEQSFHLDVLNVNGSIDETDNTLEKYFSNDKNKIIKLCMMMTHTFFLMILPLQQQPLSLMTLSGTPALPQRNAFRLRWTNLSLIIEGQKLCLLDMKHRFQF
jgi:REP element-mobilizing transposase RayT